MLNTTPQIEISKAHRIKNHSYDYILQKSSMNDPISAEFQEERSSPKNMSDEELVKLFVESQNEETFNEIVNRYCDKMFNLAWRITQNYADAEDVLQKVFMSLTSRLSTFREDSKFSTWLYKVTTNASFMHLRIERRRHEKELGFQSNVYWNESGILEGVKSKDWSDRADNLIESREALEAIEKAVSVLPEPYRIVFHLKDVEGLSNDEVAEALEISLPAVKSRIHRARLFLRDKLSDYFYE